ncbi:MAG: sigma 54-interacting transcriptional regulator [Acidimicrobiales bacterium]
MQFAEPASQRPSAYAAQAASRGGSPPDLPRTVGELRAAGWRSVPVADELRRNAAERIAAGRPVVEGVLGFDETVVPQLENALLAGHDVILLGERGQAKTRILRALATLLDEWMPVVSGSEINDDPLCPTSRFARLRVADEGDDTPLDWVHRSDRYGEKLATPDTSIADLIGEVDPIKVAEGRYLSDELTLHYGLVPRVNRGIFAINELPDLAERIQVGLLNVLEERDVQIRGHRVRLPLDVLLVATANPEDYTNRGRIITPLKDRFGAQIRTHYPRDVATEMAVVRAEARIPSDGVPVAVPEHLEEVVAEISQLARRSPHVNQRSGVSVRLSIANFETLVASARRRALRTGEPEAVPRVSDLAALVSSTQGKVEVEALEEGREEEVFAQLVASAVLAVFRRRVVLADPAGVVADFDAGRVVHTGDDLPAAQYLAALREVPGIEGPARALAGDQGESPAMLAAAVELVLEGLHLTKRLNKDASGSRALYRSRR